MQKHWWLWPEILGSEVQDPSSLTFETNWDAPAVPFSRRPCFKSRARATGNRVTVSRFQNLQENDSFCSSISLTHLMAFTETVGKWRGADTELLSAFGRNCISDLILIYKLTRWESTTGPRDNEQYWILKIVYLRKCLPTLMLDNCTNPEEKWMSFESTVDYYGLEGMIQKGHQWLLREAKHIFH